MTTHECIRHIKKISEENMAMATAIRTCLDLSEKLSADEKIPEAFAASLRDALLGEER